jgi:hypothetical protein
VLVQAAIVAAQSLPGRGALCSDNKACGEMCYDAAFGVQLENGAVSFICAKDNPRMQRNIILENAPIHKLGPQVLKISAIN